MKKRVFVAVPLPDDIKAAIAGVSWEMQKLDPRAPVAWVREEGMHITLHFLGDQDEEAIGKIDNAIGIIVSEYRKTRYALGGINFFPDARQPRVIYVSAKEQDGAMLESLQGRLGKEFEKRGIDVDHREWHPHVTIGRIKGVGAPAAQYAVMGVEPVPFLVDSIDLTESRLEPTGATYTIIKRYSLHGTSSDS